MGTSFGRVAQALKILYFFSLLLAPILVLGQKSILQQPVSISVTDKSIAAVLDKLSDNCGVRFTYNPDDISADKRISLQVNNMPLSSILSKVLGKNSLSFHERGGQIIIFRDHSFKETSPSNSSLQQQKTAEVHKSSVIQKIQDKEKNVGQHSLEVIPAVIENHKPDTLYITKHDTIKIVDTLQRTDTLVLRDTIFIIKDIQLRKDQYGKTDNGFFAEFSGTYLLSKMILTASTPEDKILAAKLGTTGTLNLPGYSVGAGIGYRFNRWTVRSGLSFTKFLQPFNYSYTNQTGGYFEIDTIEKYYTLSGPDTSWFYITDSSWLEKQVHQYNTKVQNKFSYVEFPLSVSYSVYQRNFDFYLSGGVIAGILPSAIGSFINPMSDSLVSPLKDRTLNTFILSVTGGAGAKVSLNRHTGLFAEVAYRQHISSVFKDYPISVKFGSVSFRVGLFCNF